MVENTLVFRVPGFALKAETDFFTMEMPIKLNIDYNTIVMAIKKILPKVTFATILAAFLMFSFSAAAVTKSYAAWQVLTQGPYGPITDTPMNQSVWAEWNDDFDYVSLSDGTRWSYIGDYNGNHHYSYAGGGGMPNTEYSQIVFSGDYSQFSMFYSFGMMGMMMQMRSDWRFIGNGSQPALDWLYH